MKASQRSLKKWTEQEGQLLMEAPVRARKDICLRRLGRPLAQERKLQLTELKLKAMPKASSSLSSLIKSQRKSLNTENNEWTRIRRLGE